MQFVSGKDGGPALERCLPPQVFICTAKLNLTRMCVSTYTHTHTQPVARDDQFYNIILLINQPCCLNGC